MISWHELSLCEGLFKAERIIFLEHMFFNIVYSRNTSINKFLVGI